MTDQIRPEQTSPAVGLDVGTSRIVVAHRTGGQVAYESQLNAFVTVPHSKITQTAFERENVPHAVLGSEISVHGNESQRFATYVSAEMRRPMTKGVLDAKEPESLRVIRDILTSMLKAASPAGNADRPKQKLCFTIPAAPFGAESMLTYHETTLRQILTELGYQPVAINEGLAVIYGELEASNYTGIGISCGGGLCNVCLAYLSVPVVSFSVPKAGDFIDASAASVTGERSHLVRLAKEDSFHFNGFFADKMHQVIGVYYDDMIRTLVTALKDSFAKTMNMPAFNRPIPIVLSGGTALPAGFRDRFEKILWEQDFPIQISEIRMSSDPLHSTAKGALVYALSDL
jgi:hypothetical protein